MPNLQLMLDFIEGFLSAVADFLSSEPMIYVFVCIILMFIVKVFIKFANIRL